MNFHLYAVLIFVSVLELSIQDDISCDTFRSYHMRGTSNHVRCQGNFSEAAVLKEAVKNISDSIDIFEIYNSSVELLPEDIFGENKNAKVKKFILSRSSLSLLATREYNIPPFHSVENSLESIEVYDSTLVFAWNFSALSAIKGLKTIIIENSEFITVPDTFKLWPSLRFVQLIKSNIRWVHEKAFMKNTNLRICSLAYNVIEKIKRSMFPRPSYNLWSLDLSYNNLEILPSNMFDEMYGLRELKLDHNKFKVTGKHLKRIWGGLTHLWLNGNEIVCWSMCSVIHQKREDRPIFFDSATCWKPPNKDIFLGDFLC